MRWTNFALLLHAAAFPVNDVDPTREINWKRYDQEPKRELTQADLDRIEAARLKRERRAAKRRKTP